jgi:DNA (cytosine-5)-methyltransferase 1
MTFGSLFSGIGGLDLGLERAGLRCLWQCENDSFARKVLAKHWPDARRWNDVRYFLAGKRLRRRRHEWTVDLVAGGFPCQDISYAGRGAGLSGKRSGLWHEFARIIRLLRPRFVLVENVSALLGRGLDSVLGTLASIGYDAEWESFEAAEVGTTQHRERVWILAYPHDTRREGPVWAGKPRETWPQRAPSHSEPLRSARGYWPPGPGAVSDIPRMADGSSHRMDRLRVLGNAVVPQVAEWIGRRLMEATP